MTDIDSDDISLVQRYIFLRRRLVNLQAELDNVRELIRVRNIFLGDQK